MHEGGRLLARLYHIRGACHVSFCPALVPRRRHISITTVVTSSCAVVSKNVAIILLDTRSVGGFAPSSPPRHTSAVRVRGHVMVMLGERAKCVAGFGLRRRGRRGRERAGRTLSLSIASRGRVHRCARCVPTVCRWLGVRISSADASDVVVHGRPAVPHTYLELAVSFLGDLGWGLGDGPDGEVVEQTNSRACACACRPVGT
nr:hypothetical protein CFP56_13364 [Quercus suber]